MKNNESNRFEQFRLALLPLSLNAHERLHAMQAFLEDFKQQQVRRLAALYLKHPEMRPYSMQGSLKACATEKIDEIFQRLDEILFYQWDPIGISYSNGVRHEYEAYLPQLLYIAFTDRSVKAVMSYLDYAAAEWIGLAVKQEKLEEIAEMIILLVNESFADSVNLTSVK